MHTYTLQKICDNGVNGIGKSPYEHFDDDLSIKPVSNVNDFLQSWKKVSQKNNFELYHKLLRSIKPKDLPKGKYYKIINYDSFNNLCSGHTVMHLCIIITCMMIVIN